MLTYILSISMHLQNFIKIHQLVHKILKYRHQSRVITLLKMNETYCSIIPSLHFVNINAYTKFDWNPQINSQDIEHKKNLTPNKGHNAVQNWQKKSIAIPNHSSLISMSMQSLKKIGQKRLNLESGNEALTDGRTDTQMVRRGIKRQ